MQGSMDPFRHMATNSTIKLRPYNRLKDIAKQLKIPLERIEKKLVVRRRKKYFCKFDGVWFAFSSMKTIVIPFDTARLLATKYGKRAEMIPLLEKGPPEDLAAPKVPVCHRSCMIVLFVYL